MEHLLEFEFYYNNDRLNIKKGSDLKDRLGYATFHEEDDLPNIEDRTLQAIILEEDIVVLKKMGLKIGLDNITLDLVQR